MGVCEFVGFDGRRRGAMGESGVNGDNGVEKGMCKSVVKD